jgi:hypothetical protein
MRPSQRVLNPQRLFAADQFLGRRLHVKQRLNASTIALAVITMFMFAPSASAATCTATGFVRDAINLTAAQINPAAVTSPLDATGCDIGVYFDHNVAGGVATLTSVDVSGARYYGVVVNGDGGSLVAHINNNQIHHIGNVPFDGSQHGVGLYIRAFFGFNVTGEATGNLVFAYQKGGIVATGRGVKIAKLDNNSVHGLGHVDFIAQNGIQISYGAMPFPSQVMSNTVTGNSYIGFPGDGSASGGILIVGGPYYGLCPDGDPCPYVKTAFIGINSALNALGPNTVLNNDVGLFVSNVAGNGNAPPTPTNNLMVANLAGSDVAYNTSYMAGISDYGNTDLIVANTIFQGGGYNGCATSIDTVGSITPFITANKPACAPPAAARASVGRLKASPEQP